MNGIGYEFPVQLIRNLDQMNPDSFNHDLMVAAEKLSANINEHAIGEDEAAALTVGTGAFGTPHLTKVEANPAFGSPGSYTPPTFSTANNGWSIPNHGNWEQVGGLTLTFNTSGCMLWIVSCVQAIWELLEGGGPIDPYASAVYQIALRLDGTILDWTISGQSDPLHQPSFAFKYEPQKSADSALPGPATPKAGVVSSIGEPCSPDRCIATSLFQLSAGSHTIDVVARRGSRTGTNIAFSLLDVVWIFDRMLFALEVPTITYGTSTAYEYEITPIESNDTITTATLNTPLNAMKTQYNDIENSNLARGALNHNHGYSSVLFSTQEYIEPATAQATSSTYPGYSSVTIDATGVGNGWYLLNDGAGNTLRTDETTPAGFAVNDKNCMLLVLANVQYRNMARGVQDNTAFTILYSIGGVVTKIPASTFFYNRAWRVTGTNLQDTLNEAWISIAGCIDFTSVAPTDDIEWIGVYASVLATDNTAVQALSYQRGSMQVIFFRP